MSPDARFAFAPLETSGAREVDDVSIRAANRGTRLRIDKDVVSSVDKTIETTERVHVGFGIFIELPSFERFRQSKRIDISETLSGEGIREKTRANNGEPGLRDIIGDDPRLRSLGIDVTDNDSLNGFTGRSVRSYDLSVDGRGIFTVDRFDVSLDELESNRDPLKPVIELSSLLSSDDRVVGSDGNDTLLGFAGDDRVSARSGDDDLKGAAGDDTLKGGDGDDRLSGGGGDDVVLGGDGNDELRGGGRADVLRGGAGDDLLLGGSGDDKLRGGADQDQLEGGAGRDRLAGGGEDDLLNGGGGDDRLFGGGGDDTLIGGGGADHFAFSGGGDDQVDDFDSAVDILDLRALSDVDTLRDLRRNHIQRDGDDLIIVHEDGSIRLEASRSDLTADSVLF